MCWFGVVRFSSVQFGRVRGTKKRANIKKSWCPPAHAAAAETFTLAGSVQRQFQDMQDLPAELSSTDEL